VRAITWRTRTTDPAGVSSDWIAAISRMARLAMKPTSLIRSARSLRCAAGFVEAHKIVARFQSWCGLWCFECG